MNQHTDRNRIEPSFRDNNIGITFRRFDELIVHRFYRTKILGQYRLYTTPSFLHIP